MRLRVGNFLVLIDESRDVSIKEQMAVISRLVENFMLILNLQFQIMY
jgi:hypothetical protein